MANHIFEQIGKIMERKINTNNEMKQAFLSYAISDISAYIQLADAKVSIIMGAVVALIAGTLACYNPISETLLKIKPCSWIGIIFSIFTLLLSISLILVFVFGILTIRGHVSKIGYKSKWFLSLSSKVYSFDAYKQDIKDMSNEDIIENMAAELYKLNDINHRKAKTVKLTICFFASTLISATVTGCILLFITIL